MTAQIPFALLNVSADTPLTGNPPPVVWEAEEPSEETMRQLTRELTSSPDNRKLHQLLELASVQDCYLFTPELPGTRAYARIFHPMAGIWEDPATGSALYAGVAAPHPGRPTRSWQPNRSPPSSSRTSASTPVPP
ncbi:hypothetical protein [Streptomyces werraensis]|uniref:hypothetical protein n=1 Tax=Streptomyces werraensis TaxID=68284 RepID=UPI00381CB34D